MIGGNEYILASTPIAQSQLPSQTKITFSPTSSEVKVKFKYGTSAWTWHGHSICITKPVMVSETYYVDVCDGGEDKYRFGFNGQEKVNEISGIGNHNTAEFWEYDTRLGRRWNLDPVDQVSVSNYATFANNPILFADVKGDHPAIVLTPAVIAALVASGAYLSYVYYNYTTGQSIDWAGASDAFIQEFDRMTDFFSLKSYGSYTPPMDGVDGFDVYRPSLLPHQLEISDINVKTYPIARIITHEGVKRESKKSFYHVLYKMEGPGGLIYIGRTSGYGTPNSLVKKRASGHHAQRYGFNITKAEPILAIESTANSYELRHIDDAYYTIRVAEDMLIRRYKAENKSGNKIVGISESNKQRTKYYETYDTYGGKGDGTMLDKDNYSDCANKPDPTKPLFSD